MRARGIQAGDVVQIVRDCCGFYLGTVYRVARIDFVAEPVYLHCAHCDYQKTALAVAWNEWRPGDYGIRVMPIAWLRKFDPPAEPLSKINELYRADPLPQTVVVARGALWTPEEWSGFLRRIEKEWPA